MTRVRYNSEASLGGRACPLLTAVGQLERLLDGPSRAPVMHARSRRRPRRLRTGVHGLGRVTSRWVLLWANQRVLVSFLKCRCILWRKRVLTGVFSAARPCVCRARAARRLQNGDAEPRVPYGTVTCGSSWDPPWRLPTGGLQRLRARGSERGQHGGSSAAPGAPHPCDAGPGA